MQCNGDKCIFIDNQVTLASVSDPHDDMVVLYFYFGITVDYDIKSIT